MNGIAAKILSNRWLTFISRLALGGILITSSIGKLQEHARFTDAVASYGILPDSLAEAYGFVLPWMELFIGCCLVLGVFVRFASLLSIPIILSFVVANIYGLVHTAPYTCDCFGDLVTLSHPVSLGIDMVMLALAGQILLDNRSAGFLSIGPLIRRISMGSGGARRFLFEKGIMLAAVVLAMALFACCAPDIQEETANLNIYVDPAGGGSVTTDPAGDDYTTGTEVTLTATPEAGYMFDHWSDGLTGSENPAGITIDSDKYITAHFAPIVTYTLTVDPTDGGTVDIDPLLDSYDPGTDVKLTANPETGYEFDGWSGDLSGSERMVTITMDSDKEITANFIPSTFTLTVTANLPRWGTVNIYPTGPYEYGTEVTLTAIPTPTYYPQSPDEVYYIFDHWSEDVSGYTDQVTITMDSDKTVTAHFLAALTVEVQPLHAGTVQIYTPLHSYGPDNDITLTAQPGSEVTLTVSHPVYYDFVRWKMNTGQELGTEESITITVDSAMKIIAEIDCGGG
ncbi:MauE/DoxX family redox-associated membrane protein [Chloroflexota bacterium]